MTTPNTPAQSERPTPEQWRVGSRFGHNANTIFRYDGKHPHDDTAICMVYDIPKNTGLSELADCPMWKVGLEHAKLIAAAPSLLRERDELKEANAKLKTEWHNKLFATEARVAELEDANAKLRAALEYAVGAMKHAARFGHCSKGGEQEGNWEHVAEAYRIARAALAQTTTTEEKK